MVREVCVRVVDQSVMMTALALSTVAALGAWALGACMAGCTVADLEPVQVVWLASIRHCPRESTITCMFFALVYFSNDIYQFVSEPLRRFLPPGSTMIATEVTSPFMAPFKLTMVVSALLAMPFVLYQAWAFVAPGMYRHEKRFAVPLLVSSIVLFYLGVAFSYYFVFYLGVAFSYYFVCPLVFGFFTSISPQGVAVMTDINHYLDFVLTMFFAFGFAFEIPVATVLLVWAGITTPEALVAKRPYVIVGCFVIAAVLTPPDVFSQTTMAVPMCLLFELGVLASRWLLREKARNAASSAGET